MIINIPIELDEKSFEEVVSRDYENKIMNEIVKRIEHTLSQFDDNYYDNYYAIRKTPEKGMTRLILNRIDSKIEEWKPEIIDATAEKLADKLRRTKAAKELVKEG